MEKMIGYCGYNCYLCAARSGDVALRQRMVDGWRKYLGHENYTAENVKCDGCLSDGRVADQQCKARPCAKEKGLESCALCDEFPCDKVRHLMGSREGLLSHLAPRLSAITEEEYNLCLRQWESMPNLIKVLVESGKLPSWTLKEP